MIRVSSLLASRRSTLRELTATTDPTTRSMLAADVARIDREIEAHHAVAVAAERRVSIRDVERQYDAALRALDCGATP